MAIIKKQAIAGGTASLKVVFTDFENGTTLVADGVPTVEIRDPRNNAVIVGQLATSLGSGQYLYNYAIPLSAVKGFYRATFSYTLLDVPDSEDVVFQVV